MKNLFLFIRPPRSLWVFNGKNSAFWPPLAFAYLASALRENVPEISVEIWDYPALKMGWKTLILELEKCRPQFIGIGEEAVSCTEGLRLAKIAKELGATVIAGGCTYSHLAKPILSTSCVDYIVHNEGEITLVNLVRALLESNNLSTIEKIKGISFRCNGQIITNPPQLLIEDLDTLPIPAYDLLPMEYYGKGSKNHPNLASIEYSRGCFDSCNFCVLWRQMGKCINDTWYPYYRTKSPERVMEEIKILVKKYDRKYLCWVDPTFNGNSSSQSQLADYLLRENYNINFSAWIRKDGIIRDEQNGALRKIVAAGLNEVFIGVENNNPAIVKSLGKHNNTYPFVKQAISILRRKYPNVFVIGSFIYGFPEDNFKSIWILQDQVYKLGLDYAFFIPLTPLPGTPYWNDKLWDNEGKNLRLFDFILPPVNTKKRFHLSLYLYICCLFDFRPKRIKEWIGIFFEKNRRKRRIKQRLFLRSLKFLLKVLVANCFLKNSSKRTAMYFPKWYND